MIYTALLPLAPAALPMSASPQPGRPTWGSASLCPVMSGPQRSQGGRTQLGKPPRLCLENKDTHPFSMTSDSIYRKLPKRMIYRVS